MLGLACSRIIQMLLTQEAFFGLALLLDFFKKIIMVKYAS